LRKAYCLHDVRAVLELPSLPSLDGENKHEKQHAFVCGVGSGGRSDIRDPYRCLAADGEGRYTIELYARRSAGAVFKRDVTHEIGEARDHAAADGTAGRAI